MASRRFLTPETASQAAAAEGTDVDADAAVPPASSLVLQWHLHGSAVTKVAIAGNVIVVLLFFAGIIWRLFFTRTTATVTTAQNDGAAAVDSAQAQVSPRTFSSSSASISSSSSTPPCASPRSGGGLGKADLLALPVYVHGGGEGEEEPAVECAVCIGELRDGETGRMLPRCGHRFHAECVDRWFRLHVTCPLCRAAVVVDGGSGK